MYIDRPFHRMMAEARRQKGLTLREMAQRLDISHTALALIENGTRPAVKDMALLSRMAKVLDLEPFLFATLAAANRLAQGLARDVAGMGESPKGYRMIIQRPDGSIAFNLEVSTLCGYYEPPREVDVRQNGAGNAESSDLRQGL